MPILNYSTSIAAEKSVLEVQKILSAAGAHRIMLDYEAGQPSVIHFAVSIAKTAITFKLAANWRGVNKALKNQKKPKVAARYLTEAHARNVCWRIIKDWVEAQMAIIQSEQADLATIFLPYAVNKTGNTLAEVILKEPGKFFLLENGQ